MKTVMQADDRRLLERVAGGDHEAFEILFHRYRPRISRFAARLTSRRDILDEVVNDTLLVVWQKAAGFRGDSRPSSWIFGIAYRTTLKKLGRTLRVKEQELSADVDPVDSEEPETLMSRRQSRESIRRALRSLSPEHRAVVELTFFEGLSYPEIARIVGCPHNTVKTRMFHARRRLKRVLSNLRPAAAADRSLSDVS